MTENSRCYDVIPFVPAHAEGVVKLILEIQQTEFQLPITLKDQPDLQRIPGFYQQGCGNFWVAVEHGCVVGTIALLDIGNQQAALRKMFVVQSRRGGEHGVAGSLLSALLDWSLTHGVREVYLGTTARFLAAHRFYERNGFHEIGPDELPDTFPIMAVDTKFYRRNIAIPPE